MTTWVLRIGAALTTLGLLACGESNSPTSPSPTALSSEVRAALERSIRDEYQAETTYASVIEDLGPVLPFVNVLNAEQRHSASIALLFERRGLAPPANEWTRATVSHYTSVSAACRAAALTERANVAMYDELSRLTLPADVRQVFENVRRASLSSHLPAFERCS